MPPEEIIEPPQNQKRFIIDYEKVGTFRDLRLIVRTMTIMLGFEIYESSPLFEDFKPFLKEIKEVDGV